MPKALYVIVYTSLSLYSHTYLLNHLHLHILIVNADKNLPPQFFPRTVGTQGSQAR